MVMTISIIICIVAIILAKIFYDVDLDCLHGISIVVAIIAGIVIICNALGIWTRCPECEKKFAYCHNYCTGCGYAFEVKCSNGHTNHNKNNFCYRCGESLAR